MHSESLLGQGLVRDGRCWKLRLSCLLFAPRQKQHRIGRSVVCATQSPTAMLRIRILSGVGVLTDVKELDYMAFLLDSDKGCFSVATLWTILSSLTRPWT